MEWIDLIIYVIIVIVLIKVIFIEWGQIDISNDNSRAVYYNFKLDENDDCSSLLDKMYGNSKYHTNTIIWRINLISAIIAGFILVYILYGKIPTSLHLVIAIIVIYTTLYLIYHFYGKHFALPSIKQIEDIKHEIAKNCI